MSGTSSPQGGLTRRSFLKTTGAVAGTAAIGAMVTPSLQVLAAENAVDSGEEQIFYSVCGINCPGQKCGMKVHVREGKVMKVSPKDPAPAPAGLEGYEYGRRPCLRGRAHMQWIYHPERIQYPLRRVDGTERGAGQWERITWDEAIKEIAEKFMSYQKEYGKTSIGMIQGTGNNGMVQGGQGVYTRFYNVIQATFFDYCLDWGWAHGEGRVLGQIYSSNNTYWDFKNSKTILLWGSNVTDSMIQYWRWVDEAHKGGTKLVCIDPRFSIAASKSDMFVPLRSGSDSALVQALLYVVIEREMYDREYTLLHTVAPFLVREDTGLFLRMSDLGVAPTEGPVNALTGKATMIDPAVVWDEAANAFASEKEAATPALSGDRTIEGIKVSTAFDLLKKEVADNTPEWASELTGLEPSVIEEIAALVADGPCGVSVGFGFDRVDNSDIIAHGIATLLSLTGNIAVPGGGICFPPNCHGGMIGSGKKWTNPDPEKKCTMVPWQCLPDILKTGEFKGKPYQFKALLNLNHNPFSNHTQQKEFLEELLPLIDFVVTHDSRMTDTCRYSDIVLPAAHYFEADDLSTSDWLQISEKAIEPLYESKSNVDFLAELATAMGLGEYFTQTPLEVAKEIVEESEAARKAGITFDRLMEEKTLFNIAEDSYSGVVWSDFKFPSPSGKLEFYQEKPKPRMDYGQIIDEAQYRLPTYSHPYEAWDGNPLKEQYPLVLFQEHSRWRAHTAFGHLPWLRELDPEPVVKLSPHDAASRDIVAGDTVKAFNDRGSVTLKARIDPGLPDGMCNIPKGWDKHQCIDGCYQELTSRRINPMNLNQPFNDALVEVQKVQ